MNEIDFPLLSLGLPEISFDFLLKLRAALLEQGPVVVAWYLFDFGRV